MLGPSEGNWTEDYDHENGQYYCRCIYCRNQFIGHKRRVVCKLCSAATVKTDAAFPEKK